MQSPTSKNYIIQVTLFTVIATCCNLPFKVAKRPMHNAVSHKGWDGFNTLQNTLFKVRDADKLS